MSQRASGGRSVHGSSSHPKSREGRVAGTPRSEPGHISWPPFLCVEGAGTTDGLVNMGAPSEPGCAPILTPCPCASRIQCELWARPPSSQHSPAAPSLLVRPLPRPIFEFSALGLLPCSLRLMFPLPQALTGSLPPEPPPACSCSSLGLRAGAPPPGAPRAGGALTASHMERVSLTGKAMPPPSHRCHPDLRLQVSRT